ncbi:GtrA family protein [Clostridium sp. AM58-1XD]|uniref:GtrA family protein n=1 Tax=Clostridium sp. AM58-1XD TaxID=2292307 RepID=UPI000E488EE5|nr:GtrA family protein [Clostridium sp. AM58-1XD]RGY94713.1 GtrA family protein [Clostridium sp. AM58-1XD]
MEQTSKKSFLLKMINRETVSYGLFGVLTSALNVGLFQLLLWCNLDYKYANLITLVIVKLIAYVCNKNFVFHSKTGSYMGLVKEFCRFVVARGLTMIIDYAGLIIMVELLMCDKFLSKCFITAFVIIINYFIGKKHVFKDSTRKDTGI